MNVIELLWNTQVRLLSLESQWACAEEEVHIGWFSCHSLLSPLKETCILLENRSGSDRRCRAVPAGMCLEAWLAGVCTSLPKAIGLAAELFPLILHECSKIIHQEFY